MITVEDYFRKPHSVEQRTEAEVLLRTVRAMVNEAVENDAFTWKADPDTNCCISGQKGGDGDGGFRTPGSRTGGAGSAHREAKAVDVYDPENLLDTWLDAFEGPDGQNTKLAEHGLYREHPTDTPGWCHLQTRPPGSGRRTFNP